MGESISKECNTLSKKIWNFRIKDNVWISTELISYSKFFWFVFSGIQTEYGEIQSISLYSVQIQENTDQENSEYGNFSRSANFMPRHVNDNVGWQLSRSIFKKLITKFKFFLEIDLFVSQINKQPDEYVSWHPDSHSLAVDAFSLSWGELNFFDFPPFIMISRLISKIIEENASKIIPLVVNTKLVHTDDTNLVDFPAKIPSL